jgi:hypothetical protein
MSNKDIDAKLEYEFYDSSNGFPNSCMPFYIQGLQKDELKYHLSWKYRPSSKNLSTTDNIQKWLGSKLMPWKRNPDVQRKVVDALETLEGSVPLYSFVIKELFSFKHRFILCSSQFEFGFPHTNSFYIFLPNDFIEKNSVTFLAKTILHEMTHIYQRFTTEKSLLEGISSALGYHPFPTDCRILLYDVPKSHLKIENPDLFRHNVYFYLQDGKRYIFVLFYDREKNQMVRLSFQWRNTSQTKGKSIFHFALCDFIPKTSILSSQYDHPYEVIACFWADNYHLL